MLVLAPVAWVMAAPHAGGGGQAEGEHGDVAHGGGEHRGDRPGPEGHGRTDDHRGSPRYGSYGDPVYPYAEPAVAQYWYYCGSAGAYYPYVAECPEGWQPVVP